MAEGAPNVGLIKKGSSMAQSDGAESRATANFAQKQIQNQLASAKRSNMGKDIAEDEDDFEVSRVPVDTVASESAGVISHKFKPDIR